MTTRWGVLPEILEPDLEIELEAITPMNSGSGGAGGLALLPGLVLQPAPQVGVFGVGANPLKLAGAAPPLREFCFHQSAPQNVTAEPIALFRSPITKEPPPGANAKMSTRQMAAAVLGWSVIVVVMVKNPVEL